MRVCVCVCNYDINLTLKAFLNNEIFTAFYTRQYG